MGGIFFGTTADVSRRQANPPAVQLTPACRLTIERVRLALSGQNKDTSGGDFWEGKRRWVVRVLGEAEVAEQLEGLVLRPAGPPAGSAPPRGRTGTRRTHGRR